MARCAACNQLMVGGYKAGAGFLLIPLISMGTYRVIYTGPKAYVGRRVMKSSALTPKPIE